MMSPGKDSDLGVVGKGSSGNDGLGGKGLDTGGKVDAGITSISEVRTRTSDSLEDTPFSLYGTLSVPIIR